MRIKIRNVCKYFLLGLFFLQDDHVFAARQLKDIAAQLERNEALQLELFSADTSALYNFLSEHFSHQNNPRAHGIPNFLTCPTEFRCSFSFDPKEVRQTFHFSLLSGDLHLEVSRPVQGGTIALSIIINADKGSPHSTWELEYFHDEQTFYATTLDFDLPCLLQTLSDVESKKLCKIPLKDKNTSPTEQPDQGIAVGWIGPVQPGKNL